MKKTRQTIISIFFMLAGLFSAYGQDYAVDLSLIKAWDASVTKVTTKSNSITFMKSKSGVSIDFTESGSAFNAEEFNSLEITNKATDLDFVIIIDYSDGEQTKAFVENRTTSFSIPLNEKSKSGIDKISIQDGNIAGTLKIYSLTFKTEKSNTLIYSPDEPILDTGKQIAFNNSISSIDFVNGLKIGINIGNTFDAITGWGSPVGLKSETSWGNPKITKEQIDGYKKAGYTVIRLPVTWANHIIDDKYTIDPLWMARVKTVVNWAIEDGFYVILNEHHSVRDNMAVPLRYSEGYRTRVGDEEESERFLSAIWKQISAAFNNSYDEHLLFETMNEPRNTAHNHTWSPNYTSKTCKECHEDFLICNKYNQIILDEIRASGGNNSNRFVLIPGLCTDSGAIMNELFEMPKDSANDKLIATVHNYIMGSGPEYAEAIFTHSHEIKLDELFTKLNDNLIAKGIPVIMGETGAVKSIAESQRINWIKYFVSHAKKYGILTVLWEDGGNYSSFDRATGTCTDTNFVKAMVESAEMVESTE